jgi:hypothetical protein
MSTPKPSAVKSSVETPAVAPTPKTVKSRTERSAPVRNPAFREHEGLKALQRELNSRRPVRKSH